MYVSKDAARDLLAAATDQSPNDADAWRALIEFYIRTNQFDDAIVAADKGLAKLPNNKELVDPQSAGEGAGLDEIQSRSIFAR